MTSEYINEKFIEELVLDSVKKYSIEQFRKENEKILVSRTKLINEGEKKIKSLLTGNENLKGSCFKKFVGYFTERAKIYLGLNLLNESLRDLVVIHQIQQKRQKLLKSVFAHNMSEEGDGEEETNEYDKLLRKVIVSLIENEKSFFDLLNNRMLYNPSLFQFEDQTKERYIPCEWDDNDNNEVFGEKFLANLRKYLNLTDDNYIHQEKITSFQESVSTKSYRHDFEYSEYLENETLIWFDEDLLKKIDDYIWKRSFTTNSKLPKDEKKDEGDVLPSSYIVNNNDNIRFIGFLDSRKKPIGYGVEYEVFTGSFLKRKTKKYRLLFYGKYNDKGLRDGDGCKVFNSKKDGSLVFEGSYRNGMRGEERNEYTHFPKNNTSYKPVEASHMSPSDQNNDDDQPTWIQEQSKIINENEGKMKVLLSECKPEIGSEECFKEYLGYFSNRISHFHSDSKYYCSRSKEIIQDLLLVYQLRRNKSRYKYNVSKEVVKVSDNFLKKSISSLIEKEKDGKECSKLIQNFLLTILDYSWLNDSVLGDENSIFSSQKSKWEEKDFGEMKNEFFELYNKEIENLIQKMVKEKKFSPFLQHLSQISYRSNDFKYSKFVEEETKKRFDEILRKEVMEFFEVFSEKLKELLKRMFTTNGEISTEDNDERLDEEEEEERTSSSNSKTFLFGLFDDRKKPIGFVLKYYGFKTTVLSKTKYRRLFYGKYNEKGLVHGEGCKEFSSKDGTLIFEGHFRNGKREGKGREIDESQKGLPKTTFEGRFRNNKKHGQGEAYDPVTRVVRTGKWIKGVLDPKTEFKFSCPILKYNDIQRKDSVGNGAYGNIYKVKTSSLDFLKKILVGGEAIKESHVAVKIMNKATSSLDREQTFRYIRRGIGFCRSVESKHILEIYGIIRGTLEIGYVMKLCEKSIDKVIRGGNISLEEKIRILRDTAVGVKDLHHHNLIHRDLKWGNVLMDFDKVVKITDFDTVKKEESFRWRSIEQSSNIGTPGFRPPEVIIGKKYTYKSDVYAFGMMIYSLLFENLWPYSTRYQCSCGHKIKDMYIKNNHNLLEDHVARCNLRPLLNKEEIDEYPLKYPPFLVDLMVQCWDKKPFNRPSFQEIVQRFNLKSKNQKCRKITLQFPSHPGIEDQTMSFVQEITRQKIVDWIERKFKKPKGPIFDDDFEEEEEEEEEGEDEEEEEEEGEDEEENKNIFRTTKVTFLEHTQPGDGKLKFIYDDEDVKKMIKNEENPKLIVNLDYVDESNVIEQVNRRITFEEHSKMEKENEVLKEEIKIVRNSRMNFMKMSSDIKKKLQKKEEELENSGSKIKSLEMMIRKLEEEEKEKKLEEESNKISELRKQLEEQQVKSKEVTRVSDEKYTDLEKKLKSSLKSCEEKHKKATEKNTMLIEALRKEKDEEIKVKDTKIIDSNNELGNLKVKIKNIEREKENLIQTQKEKVKKLEEEIGRVTEDEERMISILLRKNTEIDELQKQLKEEQVKSKKASDENTELVKKLEESKSSLESCKYKHKKAIDEIERNHKFEITSNRKEMNMKMTEKVNHLQIEKDMLLETLRKEKDEEIKVKDTKIIDANNEIGNLRVKIKNIEREKENLIQTQKELEEKGKAKEDEKSNLQRKNDEIISKLGDNNETLKNELNNEKKKNDSITKEFGEKLGKIHERNGELQNTIEKMKEELKIRNKKIEEHGQEIQELETRLSRSKKKLENNNIAIKTDYHVEIMKISLKEKDRTIEKLRNEVKSLIKYLEDGRRNIILRCEDGDMEESEEDVSEEQEASNITHRNYQLGIERLLKTKKKKKKKKRSEEESYDEESGEATVFIRRKDSTKIPIRNGKSVMVVEKRRNKLDDIYLEYMHQTGGLPMNRKKSYVVKSKTKKKKKKKKKKKTVEHKFHNSRRKHD